MSRLILALAVVLVAICIGSYLGTQRSEGPLSPATATSPALEEPTAAALAEVGERDRVEAPDASTPAAIAAPSSDSNGPDDASLAPILLEGLVIDDSGRGIPGAEIEVDRHDHDTGGFGARMVEIKELDHLGAVTDAEGHFEVRGRLEGTVFIRAAKESFTLREELEVELPATRLTLVLEPSGSIVATLTAGSQQFAGDVYLDVRRPGADEDVDGAVSAFHGRRAARGGLRAGVYDVVLVGRLNRRTLWSTEGVQVVPGPATEDPRLQNIDLRGVIVPVVVSVVDRDGEPLSGVMVWVDSGSAKRGQTTRSDGTYEVIAGHDGVDIEVHAEGFRRVRREGVRDDVTVQLDAPLRVHLRLEAARPAAAPLVHISLEPIANDDDVDRREPWIDASIAADDTTAQLELNHAGSYRVYWSLGLVHERGSSYVHPRDIERQVIEVEDSALPQEFLLEVDPNALQEVVARVEALQAAWERRPEETDEEYERRRFQALLEANR